LFPGSGGVASVVEGLKRVTDRVMAARVSAIAVSKVYGSTWAVRGASLSVATGECLVLEGPNGSGKSTLLGMLGLMVTPTSGHVRFDGNDQDTGVARRRQVGWLSHEGWTYPDLSARANLAIVARIHGLEPGSAWERVEQRFELGEFSARPVRTCSRGQRQRVALACALLHEPTLLLLDEPTTGLDGRSVERLIGALVEERERGTSMVVVTHEHRLTERIASRRVVMERGRVLSVSRETKSERAGVDEPVQPRSP
jgi:heme exporter protein A